MSKFNELLQSVRHNPPSRLVSYLLALLAGAMLPLAFAPFGLFPLAVVAPALLFYVWKSVTPWGAFWRGWVFGLGQFGVGVSWVYVSFHDFGYMHPLLAGLLTALFVMILALYPALLGYSLVRIFPGCNRVRLLLAAPALWVLLEWVRSWLFTGFPWLLLGYSQSDSPLAGFAPVFGVYGISWATAFTASLLLYAILAGKRGALQNALPVFVLLWGAGFGLGQIEWASPSGEPLEVGLVQGNISQAIKWQPEQARPTLDLYMSESLAQGEADLLIWPETAIPLFKHEAEDFLAELDRHRRASGTDFITGIAELQADSQLAYNSILALSDHPGIYHKRRLVPFGEYVPFRTLLGGLLDLLQAPMSDFSAGPLKQPEIKVKGHVVGLSICYEDAYATEIRRAMPDAEFLVNLSNDAWFGDSIAPHQHLQIARMRALENSRYLLRATNTGISAIIGPKGKILARSPQFEVNVLRGQVQPLRHCTPYALSGNGPLVFIMLACLIAGIMLHYYWLPSYHRP
jgi:apolipoprotein N-acyltransferase